jgi:hypothetical protein
MSEIQHRRVVTRERRIDYVNIYHASSKNRRPPSSAGEAVCQRLDYGAHAVEAGHSQRKENLFFMKPVLQFADLMSTSFGLTVSSIWIMK